MTWWRNSSRHPDPKAMAAQRRRLRDAVRVLVSASTARDPDLIARVLTRDVEIVVDTGGALPVHPQAARGRHASAELILQILSGFERLSLVEHEISGGPGILLRDDGVLVGVMNAAMGRDAISRVWVVLNPDKLIRFDVD